MADVLLRGEWGATAPLGPPMRLPARELWVHHSVTRPTDVVAADMRAIEAIGVARFGRFSYSYAVHPSGVVAEGAGLTKGAHTQDRNSFAFGIVAIGNYETTDPTDELVDGIVACGRGLIAAGHLMANPPIRGHRDQRAEGLGGNATACPGRRLYARLPEIRARILAPSAPPPAEEDDDDMLHPSATPTGHTGRVFVQLRVRERQLVAFNGGRILWPGVDSVDVFGVNVLELGPLGLSALPNGIGPSPFDGHVRCTADDGGVFDVPIDTP